MTFVHTRGCVFTATTARSNIPTSLAVTCATHEHDGISDLVRSSSFTNALDGHGQSLQVQRKILISS